MVRIVFFAFVTLMIGFVIGCEKTKRELEQKHLSLIEERLEIEKMNIQAEKELATTEANDDMLQRLYRTCATGSGKFVIQDATTGLDFYFTCQEVLMNKS